MTIVTLVPEVATPSLVLREMSLADAPGAAVYMTDPAYRRWLDLPRSGFADPIGPARLVAQACAEQRSLQRRHFLLAAADPQTGVIAGDGFIALSRTGNAEIGWGVNPKFWGRGLGTEIARALSGIAIERLLSPAVICKVMLPNVASRRVAEKAGFTFVRAIAGFRTADGRLVEVHRYRLGREAYFDQPY
ncbi:MAG: GNAT family N-acetyltransferase [Hyphomicrobiales bacterium]